MQLIFKREDMKIPPYGTPTSVYILLDPDGDIYVITKLKFLGRLDVSIPKILEIADRSIFHLSLSLPKMPSSCWVNKPLVLPARGDECMMWTRPIEVEHFRIIGKVRKALQAGCRTFEEILDYTKLHYTDVLAALAVIVQEDGGLEVKPAPRKTKGRCR